VAEALTSATQDGSTIARDLVIDVGDADFERAVIERSATTPVVVDFWAPWCGPCRQLGPVLERLAAEYAGGFVLAKVDIDAAQQVAARYEVRSIPAVVGFRDGEVRAQFVGAQPEPSVRRFLAELIPNEADILADEGDALARRGDVDAAKERYEAAIALDARNEHALFGLAQLLAGTGDIEAAQNALELIVPSPENERDVDHLAATLRMRADGDGDEATLRERLADDESDLAARIDLGRALGAQGRHEEALTELLDGVKRDPTFRDGAARLAMLDLFEMLGSEHELTNRFRRELARALYR
jgi:putative thioredoxin